MEDELRRAIVKYAQQVCLYRDSIGIWVRGEEGRNAILLNARGMNATVSSMRGRTYIIKLKYDNPIQLLLG